MNKIPWIMVAILTGVGATFALVRKQPPTPINNSMMEQDSGILERRDQSMMNGNQPGSMDATKQASGGLAATRSKPGAYKNYSLAAVAAEQAAGQKVVLFFSAPWCPFCRAADTTFRSRTENIPAGVTVLKTDYDSETALKTKYGVTYQHTFVQIDSNGNLITKWNSGGIELLKQNVR
jgi:thiol-disulfide isomerase/thioredoxin